MSGFKARHRILTAKLLQRGYWYHKLRKAFSKFYRRYYELVSTVKVGLKPLLQQTYRNQNLIATWAINSTISRADFFISSGKLLNITNVSDIT